MKSILRISTKIYDPQSNYPIIGGLEIQTYRLICAMDREQINQTVISTNKVDLHLNNTKFFSPKCQIKVFKYIFFFVQCLLNVHFNHGKYNVIHIHANGGVIPLLIGYTLHALYNVQIVYTFHCCRNASYKSKKIEFLLDVLMKSLEKKCIQQSSYNVFLSKYTVVKLVDKRILDSNSRYIIIGDAVDIKTHDFNNVDTHEKKDSKKINVVFLGRIAKEKGWDVFLKCANLFESDSRYTFNIYGSGQNVNKLLKSIRNKKIKNVYFHDAVPNFKVFQIMANADIIVVPSYYEELGSVVLEAGIMKKSVIASSTGALKEILSDNKGLLFEVGNVNELYQKIKLLEANNNKAYGENLYSYVTKNYSLASAMKKYLYVYSFV